MEDSVNKRFTLFKVNILKLTGLISSLIVSLFLIFYLIEFGLTFFSFLQLLLIIIFFYMYKNVSEKNYKLHASLWFLSVLIAILYFVIIYPNNFYSPVWMFIVLIIFTLCTNLYLGVLFLILTMTIFDLIFFNRINTYSFVTLNMQFIGYFIFGVIFTKTIEKLQKETYMYEKMLFNSSSTNGLTALFNRKHFEEISQKFLENAKKNNTKILFLILDIDHFKKINDTYGHPIGDMVLKKVATEIKNSIRKSDLVGRLGGEEFAILIENYKDGINIAEKIRKNISKLNFEADGKSFKVTISIGGIISKNYNYDYLYKKADEALYEAKKERNKSVIIKDL